MRRQRIAVATSATAAALATVALIAASGSAQSPAPTALHILAKSQKAVGFAPKHKPRQGDTVGFGAIVTGDETGRQRVICTLIGRNESVCIVHESLSKGTITAEGIALNGRVDQAPFAITGGTGAYDGARGTAIATDNADASQVDVRITLLP